MILNLKTGHVSPQFHVVLDDYFEIAPDLNSGTIPEGRKWISEHKREGHLDDEGDIIHNTKVWTDIELQSSVLFEVPKEP